MTRRLVLGLLVMVAAVGCGTQEDPYKDAAKSNQKGPGEAAMKQWAVSHPNNGAPGHEDEPGGK